MRRILFVFSTKTSERILAVTQNNIRNLKMNINAEKQVGTACSDLLIILFLIFIISKKKCLTEKWNYLRVFLNCQRFSEWSSPLSLSLSVLIFQRWKSVHQAGCFPAETRLGPKEEGIKGTRPRHSSLCISWQIGVLPPFLLSAP